MKINVLKSGDSVLSVTAEFIAVRRKSGEVDILPLVKEENGWRIDTENTVTIGYGNNQVVYEKDDVQIINF